MRVKICGITNAEDLLLADAAGADFAGFVLWPGSKRFVPLARLAELARVPVRLRRSEPLQILRRQQVPQIPASRVTRLRRESIIQNLILDLESNSQIIPECLHPVHLFRGSPYGQRSRSAAGPYQGGCFLIDDVQIDLSSHLQTIALLALNQLSLTHLAN